MAEGVQPTEKNSLTYLKGRVVKLDRGYPLVRADDGNEYRCELSTSLIKKKDKRAVIGDRVVCEIPESHDKVIIEKILPRRNKLVRKDPTEQVLPQVLAANFDRILVAQPVSDINLRRLERELVLAHETGADVSVILTKADLIGEQDKLDQIVAQVQELIGDEQLLVVSTEDQESIEKVRALIPVDEIAVLIGKSGVGKSSLVNVLVGYDIQETTAVREADGKGRHTTVSREIIPVPRGGFIVDMPGIRGLGLWDAEAGIEATFIDIEELAQQCKFRDCKHVNEPGCAVLQAVEKGTISDTRMSSYRSLKDENKEIQERREEATRLRTRTGHPRKRRGEKGTP